MSTGAVPFRYLPVIEAADMFPDFLRRSLRPDEEQNRLLVTGSPVLIEKVRADAARIDRPAPQIEIQVTAVEASSLDELLQDLTAETTGRGFNARIATETGDLRFGTLDAGAVDWDARLRALAAEGRLKIVSQPKSRVQSGKRATLFVGSEKFIKVLRSYDRQLEADLMTVRVGATLEVAPWTGGNGEVTMELRPTLSVISSQDPLTGMPTVDTRSVRTTMRTRAGETIVIGGLRERSRYRMRRKVPILGDLPLIGGLFRSKAKTVTAADLVFFVTPRVLAGSDETAAHAPPPPNDSVALASLGPDVPGADRSPSSSSGDDARRKAVAP
jgi:type II secretory pathway component GspD/PulD (secretin)